MHLAQQPLEVGGPRLLIVFLEAGQLAQVVDRAQRIVALRVGAIGLPAIVDAHATVAG